MSTTTPDTLLERLSRGDEAALAQVVTAYEPYLRKVVRRQLPEQLRAKFDSVDVVQSVWADVLHGFRERGWSFNDRNHLRAFLAQVARHRFIDRWRRYQSPAQREHRLPEDDSETLPPAAQPPPSQVVQADDLWQRMLALCPPQYRDLLWLKRQGLSPDEIARRTGLHEGSVRRILRTLARRLALPENGTTA